MADTITYKVSDMRVIPLAEKVQERNPDRAFTVAGSEFRPVDEKGKVGEPLSITSKAIDKVDVANPLFAISLKDGTLTLPEGRRGREKSAGLDEEALNTLLAGLRG